MKNDACRIAVQAVAACEARILEHGVRTDHVRTRLAEVQAVVSSLNDELTAAIGVHREPNRLQSLLDSGTRLPGESELRDHVELIAVIRHKLKIAEEDAILLTMECQQCDVAGEKLEQAVVAARRDLLRHLRSALVSRYDAAVLDVMANIVIPLRALHEELGDQDDETNTAHILGVLRLCLSDRAKDPMPFFGHGRIAHEHAPPSLRTLLALSREEVIAREISTVRDELTIPVRR